MQRGNSENKAIIITLFFLYINNSLHLARKLSANIICSEKRNVFRERSLRKTVSYEEQVMSKDKYPSILSPQMEAILFSILLRNARSFENWGI